MPIKNYRLRPLDEQVIVITGASSGIGLATAREAARRGAKVVLAARNIEALEDAVHQIEDAEGEATAVEADVGQVEDLHKVATEAISRYGRIDTWVNNAGVSIFGRILDTDEADARRLFDTNFWGMVNGSKVACEQFLRQKATDSDHACCLINIGSVAGDRAIPLQGIYSASKHAVKGFTDALRMELEKDGHRIAVTLIKPTSMDTPLPDHAKNLMSTEASLPPPVYDPQLVAEAVCHCAERYRRDMVVGGGGKMITAANMNPRAADKVMQAFVFRKSHTKTPLSQADPRAREETLFEHGYGGQIRGRYRGHVRGMSTYTTAAMHPGTAALIGAGVAAVALLALGAGARKANVAPELRRRVSDQLAGRRSGGKIKASERWSNPVPRRPEPRGVDTYPTAARVMP